MKTSELKVGDKVLYTEQPAGPYVSDPTAHDAILVEVMEVRVPHSFYASGSFGGGGGTRTVQNGVRIRSLDPHRISPDSCRVTQLWPYGLWQDAYREMAQRREQAREEQDRVKFVVQRLSQQLGIPVTTVDSDRLMLPDGGPYCLVALTDLETIAAQGVSGA